VTVNLSVNSHRSLVASAAELRQALLPFASEPFREICVPVIEYRLGNGQVDQYPASWALREQEIMRALDYFVVHQGGRDHLCIGTTMPGNNVASSIYVCPAMPQGGRTLFPVTSVIKLLLVAT